MNFPYRWVALCALLSSGVASAVAAPSPDSERFLFDRAPLDREAAGVVSYSKPIASARPSVVSVYAKSAAVLDGEDLALGYLLGEGEPPRKNEAAGLGSGVIVSKDGYIVTNAHVVDEAVELKVQLDDDRVYDARVVGIDPQTDLAVIKIEASQLSPATFADSELVEVGDVVFAIGNPLGGGKTVTMGIVSATRRHSLSPIKGSYEDFIQTDAPIHPGNSGGALIDAKGRLIGINTMIRTDGAEARAVGIGFAVPSNLAHSIASDLIETGVVTRGFLGVVLESIDEEKANRLGLSERKGAYVREANPGSPASAAGLREGDVVVAIDGKDISSPNELRLAISQRKPGTRIELRYLRDGQSHVASVELTKLGEELDAPAAAFASIELRGVSLETATAERKAEFGLDETLEGVVVTALSPDSPYAGKLAVGMAILRVNKPTVTSPEDVERSLVVGNNMLMIAYRGVYRWITLEVEAAAEE